MKTIFAGLLFFAALLSFGQKAVVSGVVTDHTTGETLPFAHVFLSNTAIVGVTDENGRYFLRDVPYGTYQLVASFVGYEQLSYNITVNESTVKHDMRLTPLVQNLQDVVVTAREDKEWSRNLKTFRRYFLGQTQNSKKCEIANTWVIDFKKEGNQLSASASEPIEVVNHAMGYKLFFYLTRFVASPTEYSIVGPVRFEVLHDDALNTSWQESRSKAFHGSQHHFLRSLYANNSTETGFKIYVGNNAVLEGEPTQTFDHSSGSHVKTLKLADFVRDHPDGFKELVADQPVEVHFEAGKDPEPVYKGILHQVSWIQSSTGIVQFDAAGNILNPQDVTVSGYWNRLRVGDMVPLNFQPGVEETPRTLEPEKLDIR